jgi:hypothetical protein
LKAISAFQAGHDGRLPALFGKALRRYLSEFDFRYSNRAALGVDDAERARDPGRNRSAANL